jgi:hypothetical protein
MMLPFLSFLSSADIRGANRPELDPFPERNLDNFDPQRHKEHIRSIDQRRNHLLQQRREGHLSELEFLGERAKLRVQANLLRAGVKLGRVHDPESPTDGPEQDNEEVELDPPEVDAEAVKAERRALAERLRNVRRNAKAKGDPRTAVVPRPSHWGMRILLLTVIALVAVPVAVLCHDHAREDCLMELQDRTPAAFAASRL